jgi:hypothetical protein
MLKLKKKLIGSVPRNSNEVVLVVRNVEVKLRIENLWTWIAFLTRFIKRRNPRKKLNKAHLIHWSKKRRKIIKVL